MEEWTFGTLVAFVGAVVTWTVAVLALVVGAVRRQGRARVLFALGALAQLAAAPLALLLAYLGLASWAERFGAAHITFDLLGQLGWPAFAGWAAMAISNSLLALASTSPQEE